MIYERRENYRLVVRIDDSPANLAQICSKRFHIPKQAIPNILPWQAVKVVPAFFALWEQPLAKAVWTDTQITNQLNSGYHWTGLNLTYAFATDASWYPYSEKNGFSTLNSTQRAVATAGHPDVG